MDLTLILSEGIRERVADGEEVKAEHLERGQGEGVCEESQMIDDPGGWSHSQSI